MWDRVSYFCAEPARRPNRLSETSAPGASAAGTVAFRGFPSGTLTLVPMTTETLPPSSALRRLPYAALWSRVVRNWGALLAVLIAVVTIRPVYQVATAALDLPWYPTGDWAVLAMRIADVGHNTPLLGPYSRFGWNHPGPPLYWMLAVPYNLLGGRSVDILAGSGLFACVVTGAVLAIAWRRGRLPLVALTSVALAILVHSMGPSMLRDPWNPYVTLLPLLLFVFLAWSGVEGDRWSWPARRSWGTKATAPCCKWRRLRSTTRTAVKRS